jgi:hypothetical protein
MNCLQKGAASRHSDCIPQSTFFVQPFTALTKESIGRQLTMRFQPKTFFFCEIALHCGLTDKIWKFAVVTKLSDEATLLLNEFF